MHCGKGHTFTLETAYKDAYGTWCPECGEGAHSYTAKDCSFCKPCVSCGKLRSLDTGKCADCWRTIKLSERKTPYPTRADWENLVKKTPTQ